MKENKTLISTEMKNLGGQKAYSEVGSVDISMFCNGPLTMFNTEEDIWCAVGTHSLFFESAKKKLVPMSIGDGTHVCIIFLL